jgi:hypothetical protein
MMEHWVIGARRARGKLACLAFPPASKQSHGLFALDVIAVSRCIRLGLWPTRQR